MKVEKVLATVVPRLNEGDPNLFAYLAASLEGCESHAEVVELASPFFESAGIAKDEKEAARLATQLAKALVGEIVDSRSEAHASVRILTAPVCMASSSTVEAAHSAVGGSSDAAAAAEPAERKGKRAQKASPPRATTRPPGKGADATLQSLEELDELDDWSSRWAEVQASGERWGGRGKGGRGIQRNTWQPRDVSVEGVTLTFQGVDLLQRTVLTLVHGRRYGLVGSNGVGKSTLLRRIAAGAVPGWPRHLRCYLVQQEVAGTAISVLETVLASDARVEALREEERALCEADVSTAGTSSSIGSGGSIGSAAATNSDGGDSVAAAVAAAGISNGEDDGPAAAAAKAKSDALARAVRLGEIYADLEALGVDTAEARARAILTGLGFDAGRLVQPTEVLSGGWRMRAALACALFCRPDVLLLDEPTNHLDLAGIVWLTDHLQRRGDDSGAVVVVSHDRAFLDAVATDTIHFKNKQLHYWPGNYSIFEAAKGEKDLHMQREEEHIQRQRRHLAQSIENMRKAASGKDGDQKKSAQIASRQKKLGRVGVEKNIHGHRWRAQTELYERGTSIRAGAENENAGGWQSGQRTRRGVAEAVDRETVFKFPEAESLGFHGAVLQLRGVAFAYPGAPPLFQNVDMEVKAGGRVGILAPNGAGKSTLLALLAGADGGVHRVAQPSGLPLLEPTAGEILAYRNLRIGVFSQHHADHLSPTLTPLQHMQASFPRENEQRLRGFLGAFGIAGDRALRPMAKLSGGQKTRVIFAEMVHHRPDLLLLDEPSNHLDLGTVVALKLALMAYGGAVVLVSHDQDLVASVTDELWVLRGGRRLMRYGGTVEDYVEELRRHLARG